MYCDSTIAARPAVYFQPHEADSLKIIILAGGLWFYVFFPMEYHLNHNQVDEARLFETKQKQYSMFEPHSIYTVSTTLPISFGHSNEKYSKLITAALIELYQMKQKLIKCSRGCVISTYCKMGKYCEFNIIANFARGTTCTPHFIYAHILFT